METQKYSKYKDSGVEWLGDIPEHWELDRIKNIGTVKARVGWKALKASEYVKSCLLYTSPSPRDLSTSRMPSSA